MTEWYRRKTWTKLDEEEFFVKLARARKDGRAQYLKIQAIELVDTNDNKLLKVAESLLKKMLEEYPEDRFNKSSALKTLGDIYNETGKEDSAIEYYKMAIDFEKIYPNVQTGAYLNYGELIVKSKRVSQYEDVEKILLGRYSSLAFPIQNFKVNSILSFINNYNGKKDIAKHYAELADQNANEKTSGFHYHKELGLVNDKEIWLKKLLKK